MTAWAAVLLVASLALIAPPACIASRPSGWQNDNGDDWHHGGGSGHQPAGAPTSLPSAPVPTTVPAAAPGNATHGRRLLQSPSGPAQAGCAAAGLGCCYSPTWWAQAQTKPSVKCTTGTQNSVTAEALMQACQDGSIGASSAPCGYLSGCTDTAVNIDFCNFYENTGDYSSSLPCSSNTFNGQTIEVYSSANLKGNNNEVVWEDASVTSGQPTGVEACDVDNGASYTLTATYSKSSSWNVGAQLGAKLLKDYDVKLTGGYSESISKGTNAGVTVNVDKGQHGTVTAGSLVHHALGWWDVKLVAPYSGCTEYRVDNVAADLILPQSDPNFPTGWGVEVKPCGYPLLNGKLN